MHSAQVNVKGQCTVLPKQLNFGQSLEFEKVIIKNFLLI